MAMKILLATDGSDTARAAVDFVLKFPLPPATQFTVTTVIREVLRSDELQELPAEHRKAFEEARAQADVDAQRMLDTEVERLRQAGFGASSQIRSGHPAEQIVQLATELHTDIIVVGSHGLSGAKRFLLGSVSDRVFEYSPCSVLIVKPGATAPEIRPKLPDAGEKWRLLLAYDDSPPARRAVELCASLPLKSRAEINAITVMPLIRMYRQDIRQHLSWVWQAKKQAAEMALQWLAAEVGGKDVAVSTELIEDTSVSQAVLDAAARLDSDLVVVGHKGKKVFERFLLGSVTARIAHHAPCSVLSVRECH
jgi:nucleotide-binding universal stress UspA family protein